MIPRFKCALCRRMVPWENGSWDCMPDVCDDCWVESHENTNNLTEEKVSAAESLHEGSLAKCICEHLADQ